MLKRWVQMLGLVRFLKKESTRKKELREPTISLDLSIQLRGITVTIVHAGGRIELYPVAFPASHIMEKYPGMRVGRPDVFKRPHEALLSAEDYLLPGQKYYLIPCTTVEKLILKHLKKGNAKQPNNTEVPILAIKDFADMGAECSDESEKLILEHLKKRNVKQPNSTEEPILAIKDVADIGEHLKKGNAKQPTNTEEPKLVIKDVADIGAECSDESEKLIINHLKKGNVKKPNNPEEPILTIEDVADRGAECYDESFCSAKDFYISKDRWSKYLLRRYRSEKKPFVPPIQKPRIWKELEWEPSLTSIQELSP